MSEALTFPVASAALLEPYLPSGTASSEYRVHVTLTFATSLDSSLALAPGLRTRLSGPESKAMTHFLRSRHASILIGVSTLLADDPGLNCRIAGVTSQPRPIVIDPQYRWAPSSSDKVLQICRAGQGLAPYVITAASRIPPKSIAVLEEHGGKYIYIRPSQSEEGSGRVRFSWYDILAALDKECLPSVMVEGGGSIINSLLNPSYQPLINSVIVTIAPTWLGQGGVVVCPDRVHDDRGSAIPAGRLSNVKWHPLGEDVVLCGTLQQ